LNDLQDIFGSCFFQLQGNEGTRLVTNDIDNHLKSLSDPSLRSQENCAAMGGADNGLFIVDAVQSTWPERN
jgi:hypothetical protein